MGYCLAGGEEVAVTGCPCLFEDFTVPGLFRPLLQTVPSPNTLHMCKFFKIKNNVKTGLISSVTQSKLGPGGLFFTSHVYPFLVLTVTEERWQIDLGEGEGLGRRGWGRGWQGSTLPQDWVSVLEPCFHLLPGLRFSVYGFFCFCFWQLSFALWSLQISGCRYYWKPAEAFHAISGVLLWDLQRYLHRKSDSALAFSECGTFRSTESRSMASLEASFHFHPVCNYKERGRETLCSPHLQFCVSNRGFPSHDQYTRVSARQLLVLPKGQGS